MSSVTLGACPPGLFRTEDGAFGFKCASGDFFDIGEAVIDARADLPVEPVDIVQMLKQVEAENVRLSSALDEAHAAHDRTREKLTAAQAEKRDAEYQRQFFERRANAADRRLEQAQGAAMEMRGRLLEMRANQMVRRGDLREPSLPDAYDNGVPF